jgi:hypothetical protein
MRRARQRPAQTQSQVGLIIYQHSNNASMMSQNGKNAGKRAI